MRVVLTSIWLNAGDDLSDSLRLDASGRSLDDVTDGFFQQMSNRQRWIQTGTVPLRRVVIRCDLATVEERAWIRAHKGSPGVWYRDHTGEKLFGVYPGLVGDDPITSENRAPLSITITEVTRSEAV